jgi:hypothetical protein
MLNDAVTCVYFMSFNPQHDDVLWVLLSLYLHFTDEGIKAQNG